MSATLLALALAADPSPPLLPQKPTISAKEIVFGYAGDLWVVPRAGGDARRLTAGIGLESYPVFAPDGQTVAFAGEYEGNLDVYTIPVSGGIPQRLTHHPDGQPDQRPDLGPEGVGVGFEAVEQAGERVVGRVGAARRGGWARFEQYE